MLVVFGKQVEEPVHRGPKWKNPRIEPDQHVIFVRAIKQRDPNGRLLGMVEEVTRGMVISIVSVAGIELAKALCLKHATEVTLFHCFLAEGLYYNYIRASDGKSPACRA